MPALVSRFPLRRVCPGLLAACALTACSGANRALTLPQQAGPVPVRVQRQPSAAELAYWEQLAPARVIYVGEVHNRNSDHEYEWDVLKGFKARGVRCTVGWEMFEETQQPLLDQWDARQISTDTLLQKTDFQQHWGTLSVLYEKILRWTLAENVPSVALNAPATLSHKLAMNQALDPGEKAMLPTGFHPLPGGYEHFNEQMTGSPHAGADTHNFYQAQLLWDQTMATRVLEFLGAHPDEKLVVFLGRGHVEDGFGVPAFVAQKTDARQIIIYPSIPANPADGAPHVAAAGWRPAAGNL